MMMRDEVCRMRMYLCDGFSVGVGYPGDGTRCLKRHVMAVQSGVQ